MKSFDEIEKVILDPPSMSALVDVLAELRRVWDKQTPHKMTAEERNNWRCPVCKAYIYGVQDRYCPHCGQAIDWSE